MGGITKDLSNNFDNVTIFAFYGIFRFDSLMKPLLDLNIKILGLASFFNKFFNTS